MKPIHAVLLLLATCAFHACGPSDADDDAPVSSLNLNWTAIADRLGQQMALEPGEKVLLVGTPGDFDPLIPLLAERIAAAGAEYLGALSVTDVQPAAWQTEFVKGARGQSREALRSYLQPVDLGIMLPGATPADPPYGALQDILQQGTRRTIHFHWSGAYHLNGTEKALDPDVHAFYQRVLLETDYAALADAQQAFEEAMRGQTVRVTTPAGTDITFGIGDRPVTKQDGNASAARAALGRNLIDREVELPAGAIRVAPLEETVNGAIAFPDGQWNGQLVSGLIMTFTRGHLTEFTAGSGREAVAAELHAAGDAGRAFREFALGFNPLLSIEAAGGNWIPYYGYGAGVARLSLGDNTELGGAVGGGYVRWNFFTDATVVVGDSTWVENGRMK